MNNLETIKSNIENIANSNSPNLDLIVGDLNNTLLGLNQDDLKSLHNFVLEKIKKGKFKNTFNANSLKGVLVARLTDSTMLFNTEQERRKENKEEKTEERQTISEPDFEIEDVKDGDEYKNENENEKERNNNEESFIPEDKNPVETDTEEEFFRPPTEKENEKERNNNEENSIPEDKNPVETDTEEEFFRPPTEKENEKENESSSEEEKRIWHPWENSKKNSDRKKQRELQLKDEKRYLDEQKEFAKLSGENNSLEDYQIFLKESALSSSYRLATGFYSFEKLNLSRKQKKELNALYSQLKQLFNHELGHGYSMLNGFSEKDQRIIFLSELDPVYKSQDLGRLKELFQFYQVYEQKVKIL